MEAAVLLSISGVSLPFEAWLARLIQQWRDDDEPEPADMTIELDHGQRRTTLTLHLPPPATGAGGRSDQCHCAKLAAVTLADPYLRIQHHNDAPPEESDGRGRVVVRFEMQRLPYLLMGQPDALHLAGRCGLCRLWNAEEQRVHGLDTEDGDEEGLTYCRLRLPFFVSRGGVQPRARLDVGGGVGRDMYMCLRGQSAVTAHYRRATRNWNSATMKTIKDSLRTCQETHDACRMWSKSSTKPSLETYMGPRRLLKVTACSTEDAGGGESSSEDGLHQQLSLRLVEVDVDMLDSPYITLSHCWGSSEPGRHPSGLTLRTETLDEFSHRGISNAALDHPHARTFKDAARVVLDLGFTYLWIDALCIIQNDPLDRKREVAKMDTIYRRGLFNIAATGGFDGRDGLFLDDNSAFMYQPAEFPRRSLGGRDRFGISGPEEHFVAFLDRELKGVGIQDPLNSRGWVLQECLLSARVLSFCKADVYWYCNTQKTSTTSSDDFFKEVRCYDAHCVRMPRLPQNWARLEANLSNQTQARGWQTSIGEQISAWQEVLRLYGPTRVSYNGDRLVALSALARNFYRVTNNPTISYVAGLWSCWRNRCRQLTWRSDVNVDSDVRRHQVFPELPSWSPLRHRGKFAFDDDASDEDPTWRIEVVAIETDWQGVGGGIFGAIKGGKLTLQGALLGRVSGEPPVDVLWTKDGHRTEAYRYSEHDSRYVMIFRGPTSLQAPQGWPMRGLILEKTHQRPGQYVRVGHVSVDEGELLQAKYWYGGSGGISKPVEDDYLQFAYGTYIIELV